MKVTWILLAIFAGPLADARPLPSFQPQTSTKPVTVSWPFAAADRLAAAEGLADTERVPHSEPLLVAKEPDRNLGELKAGAPLTVKFVLINRSMRERVELLGIQAACGCTQAAFEHTMLEAGGSTHLTVQLNTLAQPTGPWTWTARVRYRKLAATEAKVEPQELPIRLHGMLTREIEITPPGLAFGLQSGELSHQVTIRDRRPQPLVIRAVAASAPYLHVQTLAAPSMGTMLLNVTVRDEAPRGEHHETLEITTNDPVYPVLRIPVRISKRPSNAVDAHPAELRVSFPSGSHETVTERIILRRADGAAVKIRHCTVEHAGIKVQWSREAGRMGLVRVELASELATSPGQAVITIEMDDPPGQTLTVPLAWS